MQNSKQPDSLKQVALLYGYSNVTILKNNLSEETINELEKLSSRKKGKKVTPKMLQCIYKDLGEPKSN